MSGDRCAAVIPTDPSVHVTDYFFPSRVVSDLRNCEYDINKNTNRSHTA